MLHCVAANDDESTPEAKVTLGEAYAAVDLSAEIEVYGDTLHGWCPPDSQVYNEAQAERAWNRLLNLFENNLA
jgi:carboxymethylenebutenolidase